MEVFDRTAFMDQAQSQGENHHCARVRMAYYQQVQSLLFDLAAGAGLAGKSCDVLELGPGLSPAWREATTMGLVYSRAEPPHIVHDATDVPWPIADGSFDVFVALQVFEHLRGKQVDAFREVRRVTRSTAIISIPFLWNVSRIRDHVGLDHRTMHDWTGLEPDMVIHLVRRAIYVYHFDREGREDLPGAI